MRLVFLACVFALGCGDDVLGDAGGADGAADARMDGGSMDSASDAPGPGDSSVGDADADTGSGAGSWFEDVAAASGIDLVRVPAQDYDTVPDRMSGGVCVIDVDHVPPLDLFFAIRPSAVSKSVLYVGRAAFDYRDETAARGLSEVGDATGCLAFDAEGDGDDDLLVTGVGSLRLFENRDGSFSDVSARLGFLPDPRDFYASAAAGDVDGDDDLDLVVAGMIRHDTTGMPALCGTVPCSAELTNFAPIASLLFLRRADGGYDERAASEAPGLFSAEPTLVVAVRDLDEDGRPDVYVGNDIGDSYRDRVLSRRVDGTLRDVAEERGLAYNRVGYGIDTMGFASGDLDGDGDLDHVVSSFENDATAVFVCGPSFCEDRAVRAGTSALAGTFRWAVALGDLDLDGDLDLLEATGHYYDDDEVAALGWTMGRAQPMNLLEGLGDATFRDPRRDPADASLRPGADRSMVLVDLDDDGRLDAVTAPAVGPIRVLRNVHPTAGHYLRVVLEGRAPNRDAVGARVAVRGGGRSQVRVQSRGDGYLGSGDPRLHFGLVDGAPSTVTVVWPGGVTTELDAVAVDSEIVVREP